jgi:hypothetical protein
VRELVREEKGRGTYTATWDASDAGGRPTVSGLYFVRMTAGKKTETVKMLLVR